MSNSLVGMRFVRWVVVGDVPGLSRKQWMCRCDCGTERPVFQDNLRSGGSRSCGCLQKEVVSAVFRKHGKTNSRTYGIWCNMRSRCGNSRTPGFCSYGGRGIAVCERWGEFENFLADMGECPDGLSIERLNNDGNYEPGNCVWAGRVQQNNNTRRNRVVEIGGRRMTIAEWSRETGEPVSRIRGRLRIGWSEREAIAGVRE